MNELIQRKVFSMLNAHETGEEAGTIEVRAYRGGAIVQRQLCETAEEATAIVEAWEQEEGIECEFTDLSHAPRFDDEIVPPDEHEH